MTAPTHEQVLALVRKRVAHFTEVRQNAVATAALDVIREPRHIDKPLMHAVKVAIARSYRHPG